MTQEVIQRRNQKTVTVMKKKKATKRNPNQAVLCFL